MATQLRIFAPPFTEVLPIEGGRFLIDTVVAPVRLYLPHLPEPGVSFKVYDATRNAALNNITIHTLCGELINGAPTLVLSTNGDMADIFREDDSANFIATITGISSGGAGGSPKAVFSGHYGGGLPTDVPTVNSAIAYDEDFPGTLWQWNGVTWH